MAVPIDLVLSQDSYLAARSFLSGDFARTRCLRCDGVFRCLNPSRENYADVSYGCFVSSIRQRRCEMFSTKAEYGGVVVVEIYVKLTTLISRIPTTTLLVRYSISVINFQNFHPLRQNGSAGLTHF